MYKIIFILLTTMLSAHIRAQEISPSGQQLIGSVIDSSDKIPIPGVNVYWIDDLNGTTTDNKGFFNLEVSVGLPARLVASFVGYTPDTLLIGSVGSPLVIALKSSLEIGTVEIREEREVFAMSVASQLNTETINRGVLRKAACCNLSESFEATASVDVVMNDAVTGSRTIQMLGLEGTYVQNLFEGIPFSRGLGNILGFDQIPGPWINAIQLTKGVGTVVNGYESMTGQINLEFLPADGEEVLHADVFANNQGRYEANAIWNKNVSDRWATAFFAGVHTQDQRMDQNKDGFLDMPIRDGVKLMNRWKYTGDLVRAQLIAKYTTEDRTAGQLDFNKASDFGNSTLYGFGINYDQAEVLGKLGFVSKGLRERSLGITGIYSFTDVDAFFGNNPYSGEQHTGRVNAIFETKLGDYSDHKITTGLHYLYDEYRESFADSAFARTERVPGIFGEYTYDRPRFTAVAGMRSDFHNMFGTQLSPRLHLKYNLRPLTTFRATVGRGFRTPNAYADQLGLLASSRTVRVLEDPMAETSWNTGVSFLHKFELLGRDAVFNVDYYYTDFQNKLVVDRDFDAGQLLFYNLDGEAFAHSFQADFQAELVRGLGFKASYKYQDVYSDMISGKLRKPMIPRHRALINLGYTSGDGNWFLDFTANYYGAARLPATSDDPSVYRPGSRSEQYFLLNSQITRVLGAFEIYVGVENIGDFIQADAIIDAENPFGPNFDATVIYSPLNGRSFYVGARLKLNTKKK
jgi:outer membrane cobalamin receptor